jgi:ferredoxin-type protein NapF
VCRTCEEECENRAVSFILQTGGIAIPAVDGKLCNGCGACLSSCPVQAVRIY